MTIKKLKDLNGNTKKSALATIDYSGRINRELEIDFDNTDFAVINRPGKGSIVTLNNIAYLPTVTATVAVVEEDDTEIDMLALLMG